MTVTDQTAPVEAATTPLPAETIEAVKNAAAKRPATLADLVSKKRRKFEFSVMTTQDGEVVELTLVFQAIPGTEYDALVAEHPPTTKQKQQGMEYNPETFGPALVAAVSLEPKLTVEDVQALITGGNWSIGEIETLQGAAYLVCQQGAGIPFTVGG